MIKNVPIKKNEMKFHSESKVSLFRKIKLCKSFKDKESISRALKAKKSEKSWRKYFIKKKPWKIIDNDRYIYIIFLCDYTISIKHFLLSYYLII